VRKHNEDYVAYHIPKEPDVLQSHGALFLVCDGVAGGTAGEIASEHAVRRILNDYYQAPADQPALPRLDGALRRFDPGRGGESSLAQSHHARWA
jgi:serine/threonine protein phosphatase PrpC